MCGWTGEQTSCRRREHKNCCFRGRNCSSGVSQGIAAHEVRASAVLLLMSLSGSIPLIETVELTSKNEFPSLLFNSFYFSLSFVNLEVDKIGPSC